MRAAVFETSEGSELVLESVSAKGRMVGRMLDMTIEQRFRNPEPTNVEVVYTFPLPWHAVLLGLEVELNGETLTGQVKAKDRARSDYEEALSEGSTGILVNVNADGTYTLELGNLLEGETCVVRLHYVQILQPEQGSLRLTLPTTIAPRYGNPVRDGKYEPHAVPEVSATVEYPFLITLAVEGELVQARIGSPSHRVGIRSIPAIGSKEGFFTEVSLGSQVWLNRDFVLVFDLLAHDSQGLTAWDRFDEGLGVVMASFTPKLPTRQTLPVAMKILVDCSGSMAGDSITAARRALHRIFEGLAEADRFSLSRFGSTVEHRSKAMWKGAPAGLAAARRWASELKANLGGTEMNLAILSTLELPGSEHNDVLLITDGEIQAIDEVLDTARKSKHRFFVVGIGASVAEGLLRRLALETGGSCEFVAPGEQVEPAIVRLYQRMSTPCVRHARIEWPKGCRIHAASVLPQGVFEGDDLTVFARLQAPGTDALTQNVRLLGRMDGVEGEICLAELQAGFIADEANTLARLAAHQRYWQLKHGAEDVPSFLKRQMPALAEKYQLVTSDTSLVLVKERTEGERAQDMPELRHVTNMLAAGWGGAGSSGVTDIKFSIKDVHTSSVRLGCGPANTSRILAMVSPSVRTVARPSAPAPHASGFDDMDDDLPELSAPLQVPVSKSEFWTNDQSAKREKTSWAAHAGLTPAGFVEWLQLNPNRTPESYAALRQTGLPEAVVDWLQFVIGQGQSEPEIVRAFVQAMAKHCYTFKQSWASSYGKLKPVCSLGTGPMCERIDVALASMTATEWPAAVVDFAEADQQS